MLHSKVVRVMLGAAALWFSEQCFGAVVSSVGETANGGQAILTGPTTVGYDLYNTTPTGTTSGAGDNTPYGGGTRLTSVPSYITSIGAIASDRSAGGFGYAPVNLPGGGSVETGVLYNHATSPGIEADLISFTVGASAPSTFYIGYITNSVPTPEDYPDSLRLRQVGGTGSGDSGLTPTAKIATGGLDVYFFRVMSASPGDSFTFSGVEQTNNGRGDYNLSSAGVLFSTVPEPASFISFAGVVSALLSRRRTRKN